MLLDQVFTPPALASLASNAATTNEVDASLIIADFAVGEGELLNAARHRWPQARFVGSDIDAETVRRIREREPEWSLGVCDFLNDESVSTCEPIKRVEGKASLVFLNPPFSCRGAMRVPAELRGESLQCSVSLGFFIRAIRFLSPKGQIIAILPAGSLESEKDDAAWAAVRRLGLVEVVGRNGKRTFEGCSLTSVIVRFALGRPPAPSFKIVCVSGDSEMGERPKSILTLVRGSIQMHTVAGGSCDGDLSLIHSTEIRDGGIDVSRRKIRTERSVVAGPMVLMTRVGQPSRQKVVFYPGDRQFAISDCVIAVLCETAAEGQLLHSRILENWALFEQEYIGSCARYTTLLRIGRSLETLGYNVRIKWWKTRKASDWPQSDQSEREIQRELVCQS